MKRARNYPFCRTERRFQTNCFRNRIKRANIHVIGVPRRGETAYHRKLFEEIIVETSKFDARYRFIDSRSVNHKQDKLKENCPDICNQTAVKRNSQRTVPNTEGENDLKDRCLIKN